MRAATANNFLEYNFSKINFVAGGSSFAIHFLILAALLISFENVNLPPQNYVEVSLVPASIAKLEQQKNQPQDFIKEEKIISVKEKSTFEIQQPEQAEKTSEKNITEKTSASENSDAIMAKPVFDSEYLKNPPPSYPKSAKRARIQGLVLLEVTVSAEGLPVDININKSSNHGMLDSAAIEAVRRWKFIPAKNNFSKNTIAKVIVPIEFKMQ